MATTNPTLRQHTEATTSPRPWSNNLPGWVFDTWFSNEDSPSFSCATFIRVSDLLMPMFAHGNNVAATAAVINAYQRGAQKAEVTAVSAPMGGATPDRMAVLHEPSGEVWDFTLKQFGPEMPFPGVFSGVDEWRVFCSRLYEGRGRI